MSARQNKKRRGNLNRARTLTIQDIPDLQRSSLNLTQTISVAAPLTSPFPVASSPGNPAPTNGPHTPSSPSSFPPSRRRLRFRRRPPLPLQRPPHPGSDHDSYPPRAPLRMQHPQQAHFVPDPALPRGQGDLEALERLKETIKNNQHEIFRATPRLDVLASLYQGPLGSLLPPSSLSVPPHPEQMQSNPAEKAAAVTTSSGGSFETVSSSGFPGDARHAHAHAPVQGVPLASGGPRPGISGNMVPPSPRDQTRNPTNGRAPVTPSRHSFRSPSVEHATDVNGTHSGPNPLPPSRTTADSTFAPREQPSPGNAQRISQQQHQMLTSPERRRPGADNDRTARAPPLPPPAYPSEHNRERPPPPPPSREVPRPYDRERDWVREQQHEVERTHERERRWSLSDQRRLEFDRRPLDDRRPPNYDRRPPHLDDKRPLGYVDRRPPDDRRFPPDYDRRPLSEESRFGIAPSQDLPSQGPHIANGNGNERRLSISQVMKTGGPAAAPLTSSSATPSSTAGTAAHAMTPAPMDSAADRDVAGDHRPVSVSSSPAPMSVDGQRNSNARFVAPVDERSSSQVASSQDRVFVAQPQLVPRADTIRPGVLLSEGRPVRLPENTSIVTPAQSAIDNVPHARVSEPPHPERFSIPAAPVTAAGAPATDDRSRPVSVAPSSHALSVGRDEPRLQPPPPPRASSPSGVPSAHPSLPPRAREPSRERQPPTFRPSYFRSEFSRPPEDDRRLDVHPLPPPPPGPGDSFRRYDERSRWSPPPYADRRGGYREYYDRDRERERERERAYWDSSKDYRPPPPRDRDRAHPPQSQPPQWDRGRTRYSEPSYAASGSGSASGGPADRRFSDERDRDRDNRWYPPPASTFDVPPPSARRPFDAFLPRGPGPGPRPRSPGSPPPLKRARGDDGYAIPMSVVPGQGPPPPPSLPPSVAAAAAAGVAGMTAAAVPSQVPGPGEYDDYAHQQQVQIPVPIPILRQASRSPPRYGHAHGRPMHMEPYAYGAYEREGGGRGPPGAAYAREGPR